MKQFVLITAPVSSRSGYGNHARDLIRSLVDMDKYDIKIIDCKWGETPRNALDVNNPKDKIILDLFAGRDPITIQPDIYIDIRIPNEFQQYGKFNIGITAGIESDAISNSWVESCNKMDLVITTSEHSKNGILNTVYDKLQEMGNGEKQKIGESRVEKPVEVLFEGFDEDIFKKLDIDEISKDFDKFMNNKIPEDFAFLFVGLWGNGNYGEDRKDVAKLIKIFYEAFANKKKKPALILKTNGAGFSIIDYEQTLQKINEIKNSFPVDWELPNVYLLHGSMSDEEMNELYNHPKVRAFVSLTHGEGFGRPMLEASAVGLPVMTTGWSGQVDFLDQEKSLLLGGTIDQIPASQAWTDILIPESKWFNVNENDVYNGLNYVFKNIFDIKVRAKSLMNINKEKFTLNKMTEKFQEILEKHTSNIAQEMSLKLPTLTKVKNTDSEENTNKLKLPTLKKVK